MFLSLGLAGFCRPGNKEPLADLRHYTKDAPTKTAHGINRVEQRE
jgi:hypothetical protein